MKAKPTPWGNFINHADYDVLAYALLMGGGLFIQSFYHGTQAIEKYMKALIWSQNESISSEEFLKNHSHHKLSKLANVLKQYFPFYGEEAVISKIKILEEYDQATRYPFVTTKYSNGFKSSELFNINKLILRLRNDLPITRDDYILGMTIRGCHQGKPENKLSKSMLNYMEKAISEVRVIFGKEVNELVRW